VRRELVYNKDMTGYDLNNMTDGELWDLADAYFNQLG